MNTLVIIEHDNHTIRPASLCTVTAAQRCNKPITAIVFGDNIEHIAKLCATIAGIEVVICVDDSQLRHQNAENIAPVLHEISPAYDYILTNATPWGKTILPRLAAQLDVMQISDVLKIIDCETFERPNYIGSIIATVKSHDTKKLLTIRATEFEPASMTQQPCPTKQSSLTIQNTHSTIVKEQKSIGSELDSAKIIVSGGYGFETAKNYQQLLHPLAKALNASLAASRLAVDNGIAPTEYLVGQTSKIIAPEVYFAIGISGALQHVNGIKGSKYIVAINSDAHAPIFDIADYGLVANLHEAIPKLTQKLNEKFKN